MSPPAGRKVAIPYDPDTEDAVVGIIVASASGVAEASKHLIPEDFYRPEWRRAMEVAMQIPLLEGEDRRIESVASLACVPYALLEKIVADRPWSSDPGGMLAKSVKEMSRRRRVMALASEIYNGAATEPAAELSTVAHDILDELASLPAPPADIDTAAATTPGHTIGYIRRQRKATQA